MSFIPEQSTDAIVIGNGFVIEGDVRGRGTVLVDGIVKGNITAAVVKISQSGKVFGHVECEQLDAAGRISGTFVSTDLIVRSGAMLTASAEVTSKGFSLISGTVNAALKGNQVKIEAGGVFVGSLYATELDIYGTLNGSIEAGNLTVRKSGVVEGGVQYGNLVMESGSNVSGEIKRNGSPHQKEPQPAQETLRVDFPLNLVKFLRNNTAPDALRVSLVSGDALPDWISVDRENYQLVLLKASFDALGSSGESINLCLKAGGEEYIFSLPPQSI